MTSSPLFEVVIPAANAAARRLTTAAYVAAKMSAAPSNAVLEGYIDETSDALSRYCRLAKHGVRSPTFASETLRATWNATCRTRAKLLLPWRVPVTAISSAVESGATLTAADYQLTDDGILIRLSSDREICWSAGKIVVTYVAGWTELSTNLPASLQAAVAEQVKYRALAIPINPNFRSVTVDELRTEQYNVPGGDSITEEGLLIGVARAFDDLRVHPL